MRFVGLIILTVGIATLVMVYRLPLLIFLLSFEGTPNLEPPSDKEQGRWVDDYYTVQSIDDKTIAIGEPRYWQANYSYLIMGSDSAILFDSGPGVRNIEPLVRQLTPLPVTVISSHLHYDHTGNNHRFNSKAMLDIPMLRQQAHLGKIELSASQHLGENEGFAVPALEVNHWWAPGQLIDLGQRQLEVISTPGHTPESIMLYDTDQQQLFSGDYIYEGPLFGFLPGSSLPDYLRSAEQLIGKIAATTIIYSAHRSASNGIPLLGYRDLTDLRDTLLDIRAGTVTGDSYYPRIYPVNEKMKLYTDVPWLVNWETIGSP